MRVLLVEDSAIDRYLISGCLKQWGMELMVAENGTDAWTILQASDPPTLVLLDWILPGIDGLELCRRIRKLGPAETYIYIVMLTAKNRKENLLDAMEAGADDYLAKPIETSELKARIAVAERILALQYSLRMAATHDFLTGVLNRAEILAALGREVARSRRETRSAGIILADIDHFKAVNDSLGHLAGDAVLKEVAQRLKSDLRVYDVVGRYGGEEFLLLLPGCDFPTTCRRADEIRSLVCQDPIVSLVGTTSVTVSMGVTTTTSDAGATVETLLQQADSALYRAKQSGRNCVRQFLDANAVGAPRA